MTLAITTSTGEDIVPQADRVMCQIDRYTEAASITRDGDRVVLDIGDCTVQFT